MTAENLRLLFSLLSEFEAEGRKSKHIHLKEEAWAVRPGDRPLSRKQMGVLSPAAKPTNESEVHFLWVIIGSKPDTPPSDGIRT